MRDVARVAIVHRGTTQYRVPFFEELYRRGVGILVINAGLIDETLESVTYYKDGFPSVNLVGRSGGRWRGDVLRELGAFRPDVVVVQHGASLDFTWTLVLARTSTAWPLVVWTHGIEQRERFTGRRDLGGLARGLQLSLASGIICYEEQTAALLRRTYPGKIIGAARNSTNGAEIAATLEILGGRRESLKQEYGLHKKYYIAGLGRLIPSKRFALLPEVLLFIREAGLDAGCVLMGDGPERESIKSRAARLGFDESDFAMIGPVYRRGELARYLYIVDACVNPGCVGLSVVDCLFAGVPTIAGYPGPGGPFHGPEWTYITDGATGWLTSDASAESLAQAAVAFLTSGPERLAETREACMQFAASELGIPRMVDGFMDVLSKTVRRRAGK